MRGLVRSFAIRGPWRPHATAAALAALALVAAGRASAEDAVPRSPAPEGARIYFISPLPGEVVSSPVTVRFGLVGMGVAPAGVEYPGSGHHHLIIDAPTPRPDAPVPSDARHHHFGAGQTEARIELEPGEHTLQLVLGDHLHVPHDPPVASEIITITVE